MFEKVQRERMGLSFFSISDLDSVVCNLTEMRATLRTCVWVNK